MRTFCLKNKTIVSIAIMIYFLEKLLPWQINYKYYPKSLSSFNFFFITLHWLFFFYNQFEILILTYKKIKFKIKRHFSKLLEFTYKHWSYHIFDWVKKTPILLYFFNKWLLSIYIKLLWNIKHIWKKKDVFDYAFPNF